MPTTLTPYASSFAKWAGSVLTSQPPDMTQLRTRTQHEPNTTQTPRLSRTPRTLAANLDQSPRVVTSQLLIARDASMSRKLQCS